MLFGRLTVQIHLSEEGETTICRCRYSKDVHRTSAKHLQLLCLPRYKTKIARISCFSMPSTIFECQNEQHTLSVCIKCKDVEHTISVCIKCRDVPPYNA